MSGRADGRRSLACGTVNETRFFAGPSSFFQRSAGGHLSHTHTHAELLERFICNRAILGTPTNSNTRNAVSSNSSAPRPSPLLSPPQHTGGASNIHCRIVDAAATVPASVGVNAEFSSLTELQHPLPRGCVFCSGTTCTPSTAGTGRTIPSAEEAFQYTEVGCQR